MRLPAPRSELIPWMCTLTRPGVSMSSHSYEVRVEGDLAALADLGELTVIESIEREVTTVLSATFEDMEALSATLRRLRAYGLEVIEIRRVPGAEEPVADESLRASDAVRGPDEDR